MNIDVVRSKKPVDETSETAMFVATSHTSCARRALQPGTERAPAASPASQTPPALPRSPSAELKSAQGPITDASNGARGDRALRGDEWGRGGRGREGGRQPGAAGGRASQQHQESESAAKNRAVGGWMGVRTPSLVADGVQETGRAVLICTAWLAGELLRDRAQRTLLTLYSPKDAARLPVGRFERRTGACL